MAEHTIEEKKNSMLCKHRFPCNTLTHSINEDLLNIKRKGDPEVSYPLSYVRYHWNLCVIKVIYFLIYLISSDILTRIIGSYIRSWERPGDLPRVIEILCLLASGAQRKRARRHNNFYHEWKITRAFPTTHVSTYFFRKPTTFTIANSLHKLSDQYHKIERYEVHIT